MTRTIRNVGGAAALAVAATALTLPLATPARATTGPVEKAFVLADQIGGDGYYGIYTMTTPTGTETALPGAGESATTDIYDVSSSLDGSRVAYVIDTYASASASAPSKEQVVVRDISGQLVRVAASVSPSTAGVFSPVLSPDGSAVVWGYGTASGVSLRRTVLSTGATTAVATGLVDATFLNSSTLLAFSTTTSKWVTIPATGGATTAVTGLSSGATAVRVSPASGTSLVWTLDKTTGSADVEDIQTGTLDLGTHTVSGVATLATGQNNHSAAFSMSGATVYYVHDDGNGGSGDVFSVPVASPGTGTAVGATASTDEQEVAIGTTDDGTAPGSATGTNATLGATSLTLHWTNPADTDLSGVIISRTGASSVYVPAPLTSYTATGLASGQTYTFTITAKDRSGQVAAANDPADQVVGTTVAAGATFASPTSTGSTTVPFRVKWATARPAGVVYDIASSTNGGSFTPWLTGTTALSASFTNAVAGGNYRFRVIAHDSHGNSTPYMFSGVAVVPFDQTKASYSGGANVGGTSAYLRSMRQLRTTAAYGRLTVTGRTIQFIGLRCSTCGGMVVYEGKTLIAKVDTYSSTTKWRVVLASKTYSVSGTHTFVIRSLATAGRPAVDLDAFGVLH